MSVFKKLMGFLFEEEEEVLDEGSLEDINFKEPVSYETTKVHREDRVVQKRQEGSTYSRQDVRMENAESMASSNRAVAEMKEESVQPPVQESHFTKIDLVKEEKKKEIAAQVYQTSARKKVQRNETAKKEYEFTPVISPIFGSSDTAKQTSAKANSVIPQQTTTKKAKKTNPLGTILSPMYGATELEEIEEESAVKVQEEKVEQVIEQEAFQPKEAVEEIFDQSEEETESVPLEELLQTEEMGNTEELRQISLFGEEETIHSDSNENAYTITE